MRVPKKLSVRLHSCPYCGFEAHRDHNAALNVLDKALNKASKIASFSRGRFQLARVFRAETGMTPREYRRRKAARDGKEAFSRTDARDMPRL